MEQMVVFVGALVALYLVPGPDMVLVLQTSSAQGRGRGVATALGLGWARAAHVALAATGLATLLKTAPWAFELVRLVGVIYLVWLGIKIARAPSMAVDTGSPGARNTRGDYRAAAWRGLLTNITNPKALLFCSILLPQFIRPDGGSLGEQFLLLGALLVGIGLLFDGMYVMVGAALGRWINRSPTVQSVQRWLFASMLIGFGIHLALTGQPQ